MSSQCTGGRYIANVERAADKGTVGWDLSTSGVDEGRMGRKSEGYIDTNMSSEGCVNMISRQHVGGNSERCVKR